MIVYRPHRGSLADAMAEMQSFGDIHEMFNYIIKNESYVWGVPPYDIEDLSLSEIIGDDDRVGWKNVRYVLTRRCGDRVYNHLQCIGMCCEK